jgi:hypothetical protein
VPPNFSRNPLTGRVAAFALDVGGADEAAPPIFGLARELGQWLDGVALALTAPVTLPVLD